MLAKEILVFCGERSVSWSCFSMLQEHLQNIQNYGRMEHIPFAWPVFGSAALRIVSKRSAWKSLPLETIGLPIEDVLEDFADMESTELKDKVYALLGIIQPFEDGSSILIDYSKTTAAIYRDVLRNVFYHRENLDVLVKQRFKKLLKESLGLSAIDVMEREPTTEARILIGVENCGPMIIKTMETQAIERFRSRESELDVPLRKAIAEIVECGDLPWIWEYRIEAIHTTAIDPETKPLLEQVAERERIAAMDNAEPMLLAALKKHLKNSFELGVETTMRWVQESRFEVESVRDEALDSQMELRMMRLLETHIERHAKPSIQSAMDAAIRSAKMSAIAQTRLTMRQLPGSVAERWRHEYIAAWICKWQRGEITLWSTGLWGRIDRWLDDWYIRQLEDMITRMSLTTMVKDYITEHQRSYLMDTNVRYYFFPTASNRRDRVLRIKWNRRDGINEGYPSHQLSHILEWYDYRFKDIVLEAIRHWHLKNGVFDPSSTEIQAEIKEKVNRLLQSGLSDA
jgi:hypothetical protein